MALDVQELERKAALAAREAALLASLADAKALWVWAVNGGATPADTVELVAAVATAERRCREHAAAVFAPPVVRQPAPVTTVPPVVRKAVPAGALPASAAASIASAVTRATAAPVRPVAREGENAYRGPRASRLFGREVRYPEVFGRKAG